MTETASGTEGAALVPALDGASLVDDLGAATPGDYGDPAQEYELLATDAAVVDRSVGGAVRVTGRDARSFLDSLASQDVAALADGAGAHSLLLQPQGKLTADFRVLQIGAEELWLDTDVGAGAVLAAGLNRFKIRVQVDVVDVTAEQARISVKGPRAVDRVNEVLGVAVPDAPHAHVAWKGARVVRADWPTLSGVDILGPRADVEAAWDALTDAGVGRAGLRALEAHRVEAGVPRQGHELDDTTIPQEASLELDAVSFTKGCFLGQELVCRIDTRGHVNRLLRGVVAAGDREPVAGTEVHSGEKVVGHVTTVAASPRFGVIALALLRREVEPGAAIEVEIDGERVAAEVRELPLVDR
jgi:folate-binding protein YgfZ